MNGRRRFTHPVPAARQAARRRAEGEDDAGFTLIELLVVVVIMPIVIGGISVALLSVFSSRGVWPTASETRTTRWSHR